MKDDVDEPDSVDSDGDVDMERDGEDEEDEEEEDEKKEEEVDEDKEEEDDDDEDEDNRKEPRTIGQGEMANISADDADIMVDHLPTVLPEQGQEIREHTPRPQPPATNPGALPTTTNFRDSHTQGAGVLGAWDAPKTSPSGTNSARS